MNLQDWMNERRAEEPCLKKINAPETTMEQDLDDPSRRVV
jgi:hypothetical protein